jgi:type IV pilus assembly protein PilE
MKQLQQNGLTLIELMVTVAIIGILAGIAVPNYQENVRKSRRADAKGALLELANAMERHFTETNSYLGASTIDRGALYYNLTINTATASSYLLKATPIGVQANDKCGTLSLTQAGVRSISTTIPVTDCW